MQVSELIEQLELQYPNDITILKDKSNTGIAAAVAQQEMIKYIKMLEEQTNASR
jgi:hypothetical protein